MDTLLCIGKDSEKRNFEVYMQNDGKEWTLYVHSIPPPNSGEFFEMNLVEIDDETLKVVLMSHHDEPIYVAMGIPDALIPYISCKLKKVVRSSSNLNSSENEFRLMSARKVWERIRTIGKAKYNEEQDFYYCNEDC